MNAREIDSQSSRPISDIFKVMCECYHLASTLLDSGPLTKIVPTSFGVVAVSLAFGYGSSVFGRRWALFTQKLRKTGGLEGKRVPQAIDDIFEKPISEVKIGRAKQRRILETSDSTPAPEIKPHPDTMSYAPAARFSEYPSRPIAPSPSGRSIAPYPCGPIAPFEAAWLESLGDPDEGEAHSGPRTVPSGIEAFIRRQNGDRSFAGI
jgi:hypothetical protein